MRNNINHGEYIETPLEKEKNNDGYKNRKKNFKILKRRKSTNNINTNENVDQIIA